MEAVSRNTEDHLSGGVPPDKWSNPRMAIIKTQYDPGGLSIATCSCGWTSRICNREKVREDRVDRHLAKRHNRAGLRL